jgi:WbqC-like protein family
MIVSIMQPYFFPYIGYFQLAACSDIFVFHDDVQYIKGGWVNRNRILRDGQPRWLTLPVRKAASRRQSSSANINSTSRLPRACCGKSRLIQQGTALQRSIPAG